MQNFFKKASDASPDITTPTDESENEDTLVIDENDNKSNDTTLKLTEQDIEIDTHHNDTTLKIKPSHSEEDTLAPPTKENKRFVINITLEGVPSKGKHKDSNVSDDSELKPVEQPKPAKRKIKALFGESSDEESETEPQKPKKIKSTDSDTEPEKHKKKKSTHSETKTEKSKKIKSTSHETKSDKHKKNKSTDSETEPEKHNKNKSTDSDTETEKTRKPKSTESPNHKHKKKHSKHCKEDKKADKSEEKERREAKRNKSPTAENKTTLFGDGSDSESEKELVIDDGSESHIQGTAVEERFKLEEKQLKDLSSSIESNISEDKKNQDEISNQKINFELDKTSPENNKCALSSSVDYKKLDKAHKLSIEADEVLAKLKQFAELPQEPIVIPEPVKSMEENPVKIRKSLSSSFVKIDKTKKHRQILSSKLKEHKKNKLDKDVKSHKEKERHKHKHKEEKTEKKAEKLDVAGLVVKLLMPYYKKKHISSRDLFKITARHIVHQLLAIEVTGM